MTTHQDPRAGDVQEDPVDITSFHVQRAEQGDRVSLEWVVQRFSPLLLAQADYRLGPKLRRLHEPEDLVSEVWGVVLPKLGTLATREGHKAPVLLSFLTTTLLNRINDLVKTEIAGARGRAQADVEGHDVNELLTALPADSSGVVTSAIRRERNGAIAEALRDLDPPDREVIVLRAIEQNPGTMVAFILGISEKAVSMRYRRALARLRERLPGSIFEELLED